MIRTARRIILIVNIALLLFMGWAYGAEANKLDILGIAYVTDFDLGSDALPIFPVPWPGGSYFNSTNLPPTLTQGEEAWIGDTFYLDIAKPPSVGNHGQNHFTMTFQAVNPTNYVWTEGLADAAIVSGIYSTVEATLSKRTVNPGENFFITFAFKTKIDVTSLDETRISVSYMMVGKRRYAYINIVMRPV